MSGRRSAEKITCPACGYGISRVIDSRKEARLRVCGRCTAHYITTETPTKLVPKGTRRVTPSSRSNKRQHVGVMGGSI